MKATTEQPKQNDGAQDQTASQAPMMEDEPANNLADSNGKVNGIFNLIRNHIEVVTEDANTITSWCPFHDDGNGKPPHQPNLRIWKSGGFHCNACGTKGALYKLAEQLELIEAIYEYQDEKGNPLYQIVRFKSKNFAVRHAIENGEWEWKLNGTKPTLYRLPEVLTSTGSLFVVEGEKDADTLRKAGFNATTSPFGAGKWRDEFSQYLKGKDIVVWNDADEPGRTFAQAVIKSVSIVAKSIKRIEGLGNTKDATEFFEKCNEDVNIFQEAVTKAVYDAGTIEDIIIQPEGEKEEDLDKFCFPNFPEEGYLGIAAEFADIYSKDSMMTKPHLYFSFLTYLGAYLSDKLKFSVPYAEQPRLFTVMIGSSSSTKKSSCMRTARELFEDAEMAVNFLDGVGSAEGLGSYLKGKEKTLIYCDEMSSIVSKANIENSTLLPTLCSLFESNRYSNVTKRTTIIINNAHISLLGATTPEIFLSMFDDGKYSDIGFLNRLFYVPARRTNKKPIYRGVDEKVRQELIKDLRHRKERLEKNNKEITLSEEAEKMWNNWFYSLNLEDPTTARLDTIGLRLAVLSAISLFQNEIDVRVMESTITILKWQKEVRDLSLPTPTLNQMAKMEQNIRRVLKTRKIVPESRLKDLTHANNFGIDIFNKAIKNLVSSGEIRKKESGRGTQYVWVESQQ